MNWKFGNHCKGIILMLVATLATIAPATVRGQASGTGGDGYTRVYWQGTDSSVVIYKLDSALNVVEAVRYGPYSGWIPIGMTVGNDSYTRLIWRSTNGELSTWLIDPFLNYVSSYGYGPYVGWLPEATSVDPNGYERVIWRHTLGYMAVWVLSPNQAAIVESTVYGNPAGFTPGQEGALAERGSAAALAPGQPGEKARPLPMGTTPTVERLK